MPCSRPKSQPSDSEIGSFHDPAFIGCRKMTLRNGLNFKCLSHFLNNFLLRPGLSFRRARAVRRPKINDEEYSAFRCALNKAEEKFPLYHIMNFDKSNWHLIISRRVRFGSNVWFDECITVKGDIIKNFINFIIEDISCRVRWFTTVG
jgi:hypothetical protein